MKAKLTEAKQAASRALVLKANADQVKHEARRMVYPAGSVIEHPTAYRLVMKGIAIPEDTECREELARRGWGPDEFDAKWNLARAVYHQAKAGIAKAREAAQAAADRQREATERAAHDAGNTHGGSVSEGSGTQED